MRIFLSATVEPPLHFSRPLGGGEKRFFVLWNGFYSAIFPVMDGVIAAVCGSAGDKNMTLGEMIHITGSFDFPFMRHDRRCVAEKKSESNFILGNKKKRIPPPLRPHIRPAFCISCQHSGLIWIISVIITLTVSSAFFSHFGNFISKMCDYYNCLFFVFFNKCVRENVLSNIWSRVLCEVWPCLTHKEIIFFFFFISKPLISITWEMRALLKCFAN